MAPIVRQGGKQRIGIAVAETQELSWNLFAPEL
jgi:hypothetical protein